jgi:hypothetical protein
VLDMKTKRSLSVWLAALVALTLFLALAPAGFWELARTPVEFLWGAPAQLHNGLLEVSETIPVEEATRRLFKPLGRLHVVHRYPASTPDTPTGQQPNPPRR